MKKSLNKREPVIIAEITLITAVKSIIKSLRTKGVVEISIETNQRFLSKI